MSTVPSRRRGPLRVVDIWLRPDASVAVGLWGPDDRSPFTPLWRATFDGSDLSTPEAVLRGAVAALRQLGWTDETLAAAVTATFPPAPSGLPQATLSA